MKGLYIRIYTLGGKYENEVQGVYDDWSGRIILR